MYAIRSYYGEALQITLLSSVIFWTMGFLVAYLFAYPYMDAILLGAVLMFSSTIIGLKLLPTTTLHHKP